MSKDHKDYVVHRTSCDPKSREGRDRTVEHIRHHSGVSRDDVAGVQKIRERVENHLNQRDQKR